MSLLQQLRGIWKDARYVLRNRKKYSDLEVARAKRIQAEKRLEDIKKVVAEEDARLEEVRMRALRQLDAVKAFSDYIDEESSRQLDSLDGKVFPKTGTFSSESLYNKVQDREGEGKVTAAGGVEKEKET